LRCNFLGEEFLMGDLLYNFTEWLRTTQLVELALWIGTTKANAALVSFFWAIPIIQVFHLAALSVATGAILMVSLRVYNFAGTGISFADTYRRYVGWIWWALLTLVVTGLLMIIAEPVRELINPLFWIKMVLAVVLGFSILAYLKTVAKNDAGVAPSGRGMAILVVVIWIAMIFCGRWIAYAPV
jgi:hypothetical protein